MIWQDGIVQTVALFSTDSVMILGLQKHGPGGPPVCVMGISKQFHKKLMSVCVLHLAGTTPNHITVCVEWLN